MSLIEVISRFVAFRVGAVATFFFSRVMAFWKSGFSEDHLFGARVIQNRSF